MMRLADKAGLKGWVISIYFLLAEVADYQHGCMSGILLMEGISGNFFQ